jgi:hypothetical protein
LYVGHFVPDDGLVRFQDHRPFATRPINVEKVARLLKNYLGEAASPDNLPEGWGMSILPEYIICYVNSPRPALEFAAEYAEREGATILDLGSFSLLTSEQLRQSATLNPGR